MYHIYLAQSPRLYCTCSTACTDITYCSPCTGASPDTARALGSASPGPAHVPAVHGTENRQFRLTASHPPVVQVNQPSQDLCSLLEHTAGYLGVCSEAAGPQFQVSCTLCSVTCMRFSHVPLHHFSTPIVALVVKLNIVMEFSCRKRRDLSIDYW